jgi:hypothetical protein
VRCAQCVGVGVAPRTAVSGRRGPNHAHARTQCAAPSEVPRSARRAQPPARRTWYELGPSPTQPISAMYGRAQPLGQPVMRMVMGSSPRPSLASSANTRLLAVVRVCVCVWWGEVCGVR